MSAPGPARIHHAASAHADRNEFHEPAWSATPAAAGCAVRGAYGEGSKAVGGFYQISNQVTLGASAAELTDKLVETATTIIDAEKKAREQVRSQNEAGLRDRIYRAAGTLRSAYLIETAEAIQCISDVLVGRRWACCPASTRRSCTRSSSASVRPC